MYKNKTFLAIIPARGGSKGLPGKNIKNLCGKPLIAWTIEKALKSKYLDEVMVTTDDKEIADIAKKYGANVPFLRPSELATDTATTFSVIEHTINFYKEKLKKEFDYVVLLEPTSPLREDNDIDNMIRQMLDNNKEGIVSIGEVHEHPSVMMKITNTQLEKFCKELEIKYRRQDNEKAYFPYGVAYMGKIQKILKEKTFYFKNVDFFIVKRYQCYEIDDIYDFLAIENIMKYEWRMK